MRTRTWLCTGALAGMGGCLLLNPAFDPGDSTATGGASSAGSTDSTGAAATGALPTTSADGTTSGAAATGAEGTTSGAAATESGGSSGSTTTSSGATTSPDATTDTSTTGMPVALRVDASIATCVLAAKDGVPHGDPATCTAIAVQLSDGYAGVMMVDTQVTSLDGMSRPAHSYLRFEIPELAGPVALATLHVQMAPQVTELKQTGQLARTEPFDDTTLTTASPLPVEPLALDMGPVTPNQWLSWNIPVGLIQANTPLYLGLLPSNTFGVELRGKASPDGTPYLELQVQ